MGAKAGKKGRKYGRIKRKPSHIRYEAEGRYIKNKKRKMKKMANLIHKPVRGKIDGDWITINPDNKIIKKNK